MRTKDELFRAAQREVAGYRQQAVMQAETTRRAAYAAHPALAEADGRGLFRARNENRCDRSDRSGLSLRIRHRRSTAVSPAPRKESARRQGRILPYFFCSLMALSFSKSFPKASAISARSAA